MKLLHQCHSWLRVARPTLKRIDLYVRSAALFPTPASLRFDDPRQLDFVNADVNDTSVLAKLLCVADPDDLGRRPRVEPRRLAQPANFEAQPFEVAWQLVVRQSDLKAQMIGPPERSAAKRLARIARAAWSARLLPPPE
jgi:hypothetical protein